MSGQFSQACFSRASQYVPFQTHVGSALASIGFTSSTPASLCDRNLRQGYFNHQSQCILLSDPLPLNWYEGQVTRTCSSQNSSRYKSQGNFSITSDQWRTWANHMFCHSTPFSFRTRRAIRCFSSNRNFSGVANSKFPSSWRTRWYMLIFRFLPIQGSELQVEIWVAHLFSASLTRARWSGRNLVSVGGSTFRNFGVNSASQLSINIGSTSERKKFHVWRTRWYTIFISYPTSTSRKLNMLFRNAT